MNIADQIKALEASQITIKDQLTDAVKQLEAAPDEETLLATVETLTEKVEKGEQSLAALKKAEAALAARAAASPAVVKAEHLEINAPKNAGDIMVKHAVAKLIAHVERKPVAQVIDERYSNQAFVKATFEHVTKTAIPVATTTLATWAAELTRSDTRGFIDTIKDVSVAAALASRATSLDFGGFQSIKIPKKNPLGATLSEPAFVGEGGVIPLTRFSFGSLELFRYKLAAITTYTRELFERSTPAIEGVLQSSLREAYAEVLDAALLGTAAAVAGVRPAGLLNGVAVIPPTAGGGEDAVRTDVMNLIKALTTAKLGARPVLLVNNIDALAASMMTSALSEPVFREELARGSLLGIPVISSANVAQHVAIIVDAAYLATAFDAPEFDVSDVATVTEANADGVAPTQAGADATGGALGTAGQVVPGGGIKVAGGAGASTTGYTARSLWQTYSIGLRMVAPTSWGLMQAGAVATTSPTTWST
jgi:HK97 family phage major capsid protein